jgi:Leucine-rich repeat (LRR) protein
MLAELTELLILSNKVHTTNLYFNKLTEFLEKYKARQFLQKHSNNKYTLQQLKTINKAYLVNSNIKSIKPISILTNIKKLVISCNKIVNIDSLRKLTNLRDLYLQHNKIRNISVLKTLTKLECLDITMNPIEDYNPLKNLTNLKKLYLTGSEHYKEQLQESLLNTEICIYEEL